MSGMGWKLKCGIGTLSQGMHVFCGPVVIQHLFLRLLVVFAFASLPFSPHPAYWEGWMMLLHDNER